QWRRNRPARQGSRGPASAALWRRRPGSWGRSRSQWIELAKTILLMPWPNAASDVFRPNDAGLQNPLETVLRPEGAEMDDGARAGEKAINLGSIGEIGRGDVFAGKCRREFP